jgi:hypothetical protein
MSRSYTSCPPKRLRGVLITRPRRPFIPQVTSVEPRWNDTDRGKLKRTEKPVTVPQNPHGQTRGDHKSVCSLRDVAVAKKILKWLF